MSEQSAVATASARAPGECSSSASVADRDSRMRRADHRQAILQQGTIKKVRSPSSATCSLPTELYRPTESSVRSCATPTRLTHLRERIRTLRLRGARAPRRWFAARDLVPILWRVAKVVLRHRMIEGFPRPMPQYLVGNRRLGRGGAISATSWFCRQLYARPQTVFRLYSKNPLTVL